VHNQTNFCRNDLFVPNCNLKLSNQNHAVMIPRIYNALPLEIKMIECDILFVKSVKLLLQRNNFMICINFSHANDLCFI
jgi:hypothetical protein